MNTNTYKVVTRQASGTLERVLRLVRHRGFEVNYCFAQGSDATHHVEKNMEIILQLSSERSADNLYHQLHKLIDVIEVRHFNAASVRSSLSHE